MKKQRGRCSTPSKGVMTQDAGEGMGRYEENVECFLRAPEFFPSSLKGKITSSSNDPSYHSEALILNEGSAWRYYPIQTKLII